MWGTITWIAGFSLRTIVAESLKCQANGVGDLLYINTELSRYITGFLHTERAKLQKAGGPRLNTEKVDATLDAHNNRPRPTSTISALTNGKTIFYTMQGNLLDFVYTTCAF